MNFLAIGLGYQELLIILVILLLLFGGSRLPQLASGLGKSIKSFKRGMDDGSDDDEEAEETRRRESLRAASTLEEDRLASSNKATLNRPRT
ncbi:MAG: twin-arginine translocase TatA/TatE family subunit [Pyrinomonadaceae bacterium]